MVRFVGCPYYIVITEFRLLTLQLAETQSGVIVLSASPDYELCERRTQTRMAELARQHRAAEEHLLRLQSEFAHLIPDGPENPFLDPPSPANIYGLAIVSCVVALVSLNTGHPEAPTRTLLVLDYSNVPMDVWNAIAIGMLVCQARNEQAARAAFWKKVTEWQERVGAHLVQ